ncbi:O-antigen ligase family protein [Bacteroidota bacterium]
MSKKPIKSKNTLSIKLLALSKNFIFILVLLAYGFLTVLIPNFNALDPNGPQFLSLAILNLLTYIILLLNKEIKSHSEWYYVFFKTGMGLAYLGLMIFSLLSFINAINVLESILHFAKIFTIFTAAYLISIIVLANKRNVLYLSIALTSLLIYQSITVFAELGKFISGEISSILELKPGFTNKNILAAAIFVKVPFAIWLLVFKRNWLFYFGILGVFVSLLATLILSSRSFYLGLLALSAVLIVYFLFRFIKMRQLSNIKSLSIYAILLSSVFLSFWVIQNYAYPDTKEAQERSVEARLQRAVTIEGARGRLTMWSSSLEPFQQSPLTGVGLGNWKIVTIKEENKTSTNLILRYKAHNDFIEITTETGIFGGLFFIAIFLIIGFKFLIVLFKRKYKDWIPWFFLPAFGLLCYFFDAFFNFPQDRPEIQPYFALYVGMGIAFSAMLAKEKKEKDLADSETDSSERKNVLKIFKARLFKKQTNEEGGSQVNEVFILVFSMVMIASIYILYLNVKSLQLQRIGKMEQGVYSSPSDMFVKGYPFIPNLDAHGEPIAVNKARYLLKEGQYQKLIDIVRVDNSSPYDGRREYMMAAAFAKLNMADSAKKYAEISYELKPNYYPFVTLLTDLLKIMGENEQVETILNTYLDNNKGNKQAWTYTSNFYKQQGKPKQSLAMLDSASHYFPEDNTLMQQQNSLEQSIAVASNQEVYNAATAAQNKAQYSEAAKLYTSFLEKAPNHTDALYNRAKCYYATKEHRKSIEDLEKVISQGNAIAAQYNLLGANYFSVGEKEKACENFKISADMGDKDGVNNYGKICQ